jgi:transcriptional regulator with XRE-family HTH domain
MDMGKIPLMENTLVSRLELAIAHNKTNPKRVSKAAVLSDGSRLNETYVRDIMKGRVRQPSGKKLAAVAEVLHCSAIWLLTGDGDPGFAEYIDDIHALYKHEILPWTQSYYGIQLKDVDREYKEDNIPLTFYEASQGKFPMQPELGKYAAVVITDDSAEKYGEDYIKGSVVYYLSDQKKPAQDIMFKRCVIQPANENQLIGKVLSVTDSGALIERADGKILKDVQVDWVARIKSVQGAS